MNTVFWPPKFSPRCYLSILFTIAMLFKATLCNGDDFSFSLRELTIKYHHIFLNEALPKELITHLRHVWLTHSLESVCHELDSLAHHVADEVWQVLEHHISKVLTAHS